VARYAELPAKNRSRRPANPTPLVRLAYFSLGSDGRHAPASCSSRNRGTAWKKVMLPALGILLAGLVWKRAIIVFAGFTDDVLGYFQARLG
jgi:hypothetical protein